MRQKAGGARVVVLEAVIRWRWSGRGHGYDGGRQLVTGAWGPGLLLDDRNDSVRVTEGVVSASL